LIGSRDLYLFIFNIVVVNEVQKIKRKSNRKSTLSKYKEMW